MPVLRDELARCGQLSCPQGVGIGRLTDLLALPLVVSGALVPLLQERHRLPKIRACTDHWAQWLADGR